MKGRTYLFVPGNRPDRFLKAYESGADAVIIDLEDAVPPQLKAEARATVSEWLSAEHPVYVRVNGQGTEWHDEDVRSVARAGLRGVVLPKVQDARGLSQLAAQLPDSASLLPIVESALGLWNALEIARAPRVERLAFGHLDFQRDLGIDGEREELLYARSRLVLVSRLAGIGPPVDGITAAMDDAERLRQDVEHARRLGFGGKLVIHPRQIEAVNRGFLPSEKDIEWARRVLAADEAAGGGVARMGAEMIDAPVVARARHILQLSEEGGAP